MVTLTLWRPQREAIAGVEQGQWTDIGGLVYSPLVHGAGFPDINNRQCGQSQLSTSDPSLTPAPGEGIFGGGGFRDVARDRPASRANTLTFSVNLTKCFQAPSGQRWSGGAVAMWLNAGLGSSRLSELGAPAGASSGATQQLLFTMK